MNNWLQCPLKTPDNKLVSLDDSQCFRLLEQPMTHLKNISDYKILDFGIFNKEEFSTSLIPFEIGSIHRINLNGLPFRVSIIENWVKHGILRNLKPGRLMMPVRS